MGSGEFTPQAPQFVQDVKGGVSTETVTEIINIGATGNVKDAAGSTVVIDLERGPILEKTGGRIGSFWGSPHNLQYAKEVQSVVETDGSAAFAVYDSLRDLEKLFESASSARYIAKLIDGANNEIYGWIGGVSVSGDVYTFQIFNGVALGTQNWFQGGSTAFNRTAKGARVEIYKYSTSVTFGSSDTFTEEVPYHAPDNPRNAGETEARFLFSLTNGQFGFDYKNHRFLARKANADDTETLSYKTFTGNAVAVNAYATASNSVSTAEENDRVVSSVPATLFGVSMTNENASTRYLQIHNTASAAAEGAVPIASIRVGTGETQSIDYGLRGREMTVGIYVCSSTTQNTKTLAADDHLFDAQYTA